MLKLASGEEFNGPVGGQPLQLNNNRVGVGQSRNGVIRWSRETGEVVLYADPTFQSAGNAYGINDRDEAVGNIWHFDERGCVGLQIAMFWAANAQPATLNALPGDMHAFGYAINNRSQAVGYSYRDAQGCGQLDPNQSRAVIWDGTRAVDLNTLVPQRFAREFQLSSASGINDRGQIVARGVRRGEPKAPCPFIDYDPAMGGVFYNDSIMCANEYSFLLTPKHERW